MWTPSVKQRTKAKQMGVNKGVPDYFIIIEDTLVVIELKALRGTVSPEQRDWLIDLGTISGIYPYICHGFEEAKIIVDHHIKNPHNVYRRNK